MMVVISYDVCTQDEKGPRRLRRIAKTCQNFGQRVQNSVFECIVDPAQFTSLKFNLLNEMDMEKDSIRFYFLGANYASRIEHHGNKVAIDFEGTLVL